MTMSVTRYVQRFMGSSRVAPSLLTVTGNLRGSPKAAPPLREPQRCQIHRLTHFTTLPSTLPHHLNTNLRSTSYNWRPYGLFSQADKTEAPPNSETPQEPKPATPEEMTALLQEAQELITKLEGDNEKLTKDLDDLKDKYKRGLAETENVRNRMQKQISDAKIFGIQGFCKDLLEVSDILERAVEATPKESLDENQELKTLFDGLSMTETQLLKVFARHGLTRLDPEAGDKFDPNLHEALFQLPDPSKDNNTIAVVTQKGFVLSGRTLRAAKVGVVKNS